MSHRFMDPTPASTTSPHHLYADRTMERVPLATAPAINPPRWSGRKTAIAAALALGLGGATAATAAAVNPAHESSQRGGPMMGGGGPGHRPGNQNGQNQGSQLPGGPQLGGQWPGPGHHGH